MQVFTGKTWFGGNAVEVGLVDEVEISDNVIRRFIQEGLRVIKLAPKVPDKKGMFSFLEKRKVKAFYHRVLRSLIPTLL